MKVKHQLLKAFLPMAGALLAVLPSCKQLDLVEDYSSEPQDFTIVANLGDKTRTVNDGLGTTWVADDALSVILCESGTENYATYRFTYSGSENTFKGSVPRNIPQTNDWFAVYPYREANTNPASISLTIPATQTQDGDNAKAHLAGETFPIYGYTLSVAKGNTPSIPMSNAMAVAKFKFTNNTTYPVIVKEIVFTASRPISGDFTMDITGETPEFTVNGITSNCTTLNVENTSAFAAGASAEFFVGIAPFTVSEEEEATVKVTAVKADNPSQEVVYYQTYTIPAGYTAQSGHIKGFNVNFDDKHSSGSGDEKTAQTLSFTQGTVEWTLGSTYELNGTYEPQGVNGALTPVTYTSNNTDVATIVDGNIVIKGIGTTTITATAAETEYYLSDAASYVLTIKEGSAQTIPGYELITSEPSDWSGRYIMVSSNKEFIFTGDNGTSNKYQLTSSDFNGKIITKDCSAYEFTISKSGSNYYLKHNNQYLYCSYSNGNGSTGIAYSSSQQALSLEKFSDGTFGFWMHENSTDQHLYYKASDGYFKMGGSYGSSCVYLYKYTDGAPVTPVDPSTTSYVKVTSTPTSWDGTYLIVDEASGKAFAYGQTNNAVSVTINNGTIAATTALEAAAVTISDAGVKHANNTSYEAYNVKTSNGKYMYYSNGEIVVADTNTKTDSSSGTWGGGSSTYYYYHTFMLDGNGVQMMSGRHNSGSSKYYMRYSSNAFGYQQDGTSNRVQLYKLTAGSVTPPTPSRQDQNLSFANSAITWTLGSNYQLGGAYEPQSVSGAKTTVSFVSSNTGIASIDNGMIVIKGVGSTTIIATAQSSDEYNAGTASYTLNIAEAPATPAGYQLITSEPDDWSGRYIFVSPNKDYVFTGATGTSNKYQLTSSDLNGQIITKDCSAYEFTISKSGNNYYLRHNNQYLYCSYSNGDSTTGMGFSSNQQALNLEKFSDGTFGFWMTENSTEQHLYYKASDGYFKMGHSYGSSCVYIYKYTDGSSTPVDPVDPATSSFVKVTSAPSSWDGTYLIVDEASSRAFNFNQSSSYAVAVTINNGTIAATTALEAAAVTISDAGVKHANNTSYEAYNVKTSTGKYIYYSNSQLVVADSNIKTDSGADYYYYHTLMLDNSGVQMMSGRHSNGSNKYYLRYSNGFGYNTTSSNRVQLYKLTGGSVTPPTPGKLNQNLSFANSTVNWTIGSTYKIGSSYNTQSVSGAQTTVTFTSSNTAVATIENGKILIKAAGSTTIIATAASNDTYNAGSASYTLNISSGSSTDPATGDYAKVSTEPSSWDGTYLVVDETAKKAFMPFEENAPNFAIDVTINNGVISANTDLSKYVITITDAGSNHQNSHLTGQRAYDVKNSEGKYLYWSSDFGEKDAYIHVKETNQATNSSSTYTYHHAFKIIDGGVQLVSAIDTDGGNAYYLGYSNGAFSYTDDSSRRVQLYKLNGSVTPTPEKQNQNLSFASSSVNWSLGSGYAIGSSYAIQTLSGAKTSVTYTSSNTSVATISGTQIRIAGAGSTTITATAVANDTYYAGSASYVLNISAEPTPSGTTFNLENDYLKSYLDAAAAQYTNSNNSTTIVASYTGGSSSGWGGGGASNDTPKPVTLSWNSASGSGNYTVSIYNNSGRSDLETSVTTSSTSADIYNLVPGRTYYYSVTRGGSTVKQDSFSTTGRRRMIKVSDQASQNHARNCRDLGGIQTRSGKTLNYKLMYRGTNMDSITSDEKDILLNYLGIKLDQDLRGEKSSSPLGSSVKFSNERYDANTIYNQNGSNMKTTVSDVLNSVIAGDPVYIHCYIGSDRTGHMCMLYEALLGCDIKECDIDYEITSFASSMTSGNRTRNSGNASSFRSKFTVSPYNADSIPESVEKYVTSTLGISLDTVKAYRAAMGVNETL